MILTQDYSSVFYVSVVLLMKCIPLDKFEKMILTQDICRYICEDDLTQDYSSVFVPTQQDLA